MCLWEKGSGFISTWSLWTSDIASHPSVAADTIRFGGGGRCGRGRGRDQLERLATVFAVSRGVRRRRRRMPSGEFRLQRQRGHDEHQSQHRQYADRVDHRGLVFRFRAVVELARICRRRRKLLLLLLLLPIYNLSITQQYYPTYT